MKTKRLATKFLVIFCLAITIIPTTNGLTHTQSVDCILVHNSQCGSCEDRFNGEVTSFYMKYQLDNRVNFNIYDIADSVEQDSFLNEMARLGIDLSLYGDLPYVIFVWDNNIQIFDVSNLESVDTSFQNILTDYDSISPSSPQNKSISILDFLSTFNYPILFLALVIVVAGVFFIQKGYDRYLKRHGSFIYPRRISPTRFKTILGLSLVSISLLLYQFFERLLGGCGCASGDIVQTLLFKKYDYILILGYEIPIALIGILFNLSVILQVILLGVILVRQKSRRVKMLYLFLTSQMLLASLSLLYLVYLELFVIHFICNLCTASQVIICINTILILTWQPWKFNEKKYYGSTKKVLKLPWNHSTVKRNLLQSFSFSILLFVILTSVAPIGIPTKQLSVTALNIPDSPPEFNTEICFECNNPMYIETQGPISVQSQNPVYSQINEILTEKPVFIFFYAEWCGFCKKQKPILLELREEYSNRIEFLYINAEENPQMMQDFGVTGFPTMFLIDKNEEGYIYRVFRGFNEKTALSDYFDLGYITVSVDKAKQIIDRNKKAIILDVRTPAEYETVHINDSTLIPLTHLESKLYELQKEDFIVVYCKSGGRSKEASNILKKNGFLYIHNMEGGIEAWQDAGFPVVPETETSIKFSTEAETCDSNTDCSTEEYCAKEPGDCDSTGTCEMKPEICISLWDPVCGCDGNTYGNDCEAANAGINVVYKGECLPTCTSNANCGTDKYCAKAPGDCDGTGTCEVKPEICPDVWAPVCACDRMTYGNACEAAFAGVNVAYEGECEIPTCSSNTDCGTGEYCAKDPGDCDGVGTCELKPSACLEIWDPVCGCDGITYGNICHAALAGINVAYEGECTLTCSSSADCGTGEYCAKDPGDCDGTGTCEEKPGVCPDVWDPICGCDGNTYGNECEAAAAGVNVAYEGECETPECVLDSDCDDGQFCNGIEICVVGVCEPGSAVDCNDGVSCTIDTCNEETDTCENQASNTLCDNGMFCDGVETCDVLLDCQVGVPVDCSSLDDQCSVGICDEASNECVANPGPYEGQSCDDGDPYTVGDTCSTGVCIGESVQCISDSDCDDEQFCNGIEICVAGVCEPGSSMDCNDGVGCTIDSCNEETDTCENQASNTLCDNGMFCDGIETCDVLLDCQEGTIIDCSGFEDQCNEGICDEASDQCVASPKGDGTSCDDGQFCTTNDVCMAGICGFGEVRDCSAYDDQCNEGICDEVSDQCVANSNPYEGQACDDGNLCTAGNTCSAGVCTVGTPLDCNDDNVCTDDYCDPSSGCVFTYNTASCDDGLFCNGVEVCVAGVCEPGSTVDCSDSVSCTIDSCNEETDTCENQPNDALCDNGEFCDGVETCDVLLDCQEGPFVDCSGFENQCNTGICDEASDQCVASPKADGTSCDDGEFCTVNDVCMAGICDSGAFRDCSAYTDQCNVGICDEVNDLCVADPYPKEGISCDDGDACTIGDTCQLGTCSGTLDETDSDEDGIPDCTDPCPFDSDNDIDEDGVCGDMDNCPSDFNPDQADSDGDGIGDVCENAPPIADAGGSYSGDEGTIITFNASNSNDPDGDELYYRWDLDNDGIWDTDYSLEPTLLHVWYDDHSGTIVLEVSDGEKINTTSTTISISNVDPVAHIDLILPDFFVLPGDSILFIGSLTDPGTLDTHVYEWNFDDGFVTAENLEETHSYNEPGTYNVSLTITDDDNGIGTKNVTINVISLQEALEVVKETIDGLDTCYKLKRFLKIHLELAIRFLNKAERYRIIGKEKQAIIMQKIAKFQLRIFIKIIYILGEKEWIQIDDTELLIGMTNRIIPKIEF